VAEVSVLFVDGRIQRQLDYENAFPARLEVMSGDCVFDMIGPKGLQLKLQLSADTCNQIWVRAQDADTYTTATYHASALPSGADRGLSTGAKSVSVARPGTVKFTVETVTNGSTWTFYLHQGGDPFQLRFTISSNTQRLLHTLFQKAKHAETTTLVRYLPDVGVWPERSAVVEFMAEPAHEKGVPVACKPYVGAMVGGPHTGVVVGTLAELCAYTPPEEHPRTGSGSGSAGAGAGYADE
jgi:hypothetical protein